MGESAPFTRSDAARILRVSRARLRYWERTALVSPSRGEGGQPAFDFRDLVGLRSVVGLLERGVPLRRIRRSVEDLRERVPELEHPLGALRVWLPGSGRLVARHGDALVEPDGQLVLDFEGAGGDAAEVAALEPAAAERPDPETANAWFEEGCRTDAEPSTWDEALHAYRRALEADPDFADAHCNLGTVHYNRGARAEARRCYEAALRRERFHLEANFNLAGLLEEEGAFEAALRHYRRALHADPLLADGHLAAALLLERLARRRDAREHWRRYLQLAPRGSWAEVARRHLAEPPDAS